MSEHDPRFDRWDGAYVLGALDPDDRRAYEEHLADCERCRADVADLGGVPGLLSRVPSERALGMIDETSGVAEGAAADVAPALGPVAPVDLSERLQRRARQHRVRRVLLVAGSGLVAAVLAVAVVFGVRSLNTPSPALVANLQPTAAIGTNGEDLSASVELYAKGWGTQVDTECRHAVKNGPADSPESSEQYGLYVVDSSGQDVLVSSWRGVRQSPITTTAATATRITDMRRLELRDLTSQTVLLSAPVRP